MIESLYKNKKIIDDSGALISAENTDPKILITKSDGSYLYITTDLATFCIDKIILATTNHFILLIIVNLFTSNNCLDQ